MDTQKLVWMPKGIDTGAYAPTCRIPYDGPKPKRVWTLFGETDPDKPPSLPVDPKHGVNAFMEDHIHDWNIHNRQFRYASRVSDGGVWLLFVFKDPL